MPPAAKKNLTNLESLLLAQAVWELGATQNNWSHIAKLLSRHPLVSRPKSFFTAQSCHSMYEMLMKEAELEIDQSSEAPNAPVNLSLAKKHYHARFTQLKDLILAEETKFKTVLKEIEDIRSGNFGKEAKVPEEATETELPQANADEKHKVEHEPAVTEPMVTETVDTNEETAQPDQDVEISQVSEQAPSPEAEHAPEAEVEAETEDDATATQPVESTSRASSSPPPAMNVDKETTPEAAPTDENMESQQDEASSPSDRREEEEEEELAREDDGKEEEEEASQGQNEDMGVEQDETAEAQTFKSPAQSPETVGEAEEEENGSDPAAEKEPQADEEDKDNESSAEEEPVVATRRSTRHRKSSAASAAPPAPPPRTRQRRGRPSDNEPPPAADSEAEGETKDGSASQAEDDAESRLDGPASSRRREGKRKASTNELLESPDKKRMREDSEALDDEDQGSTSHNTRGRVTRGATRTEEQVALKRFQSVIAMLHQQISQHRNGNIFHNPIKNSEAPDYHDIVKRPMDLKTIKTRVKDGVIANSLEYQRDIYLMFANAMMYNRPGSDVHAMAEDMMVESEAQIHTFRQTEGLAKRQRS